MVRLFAAVALLALGTTLALAQNAAPVRLRGTIDAVKGEEVALTSSEGAKLALTLTPQTAYGLIVPADLADIKDGDFVGSAATTEPDGTLRALEVHIFPEAMRGTSEGHHPMDRPQTTMTNATVASQAVGNDVRTLTLKYPGGEQRIVVPKGTPVVAFANGDRSVVAPGAHAVIFAAKRPDGTLAALRFQVGKDGFVPPF